MDRPPQILVLCRPAADFGSRCQEWLASPIDWVDDVRQLATDRPPAVIVLQATAPQSLGTTQSLGTSPSPDPASRAEHSPGDDSSPEALSGGTAFPGATAAGPREAIQAKEGTGALGGTGALRGMGAEPPWDCLEHPDLPWSWRQWVRDEQTRLVVLAPQTGRLEVTPQAVWLPDDVTPREMALAISQALFVGKLRQRVSVERQRGERYARFALRDPLTGLSNRRGWQMFLRRQAREPLADQPCCVALLDVDYFKQINASFGHATADQVLRRLGRSLREDLRGGDLAARLGGDEFGIVLNPSPRASTVDVLHRIRRRIREQLTQSRLPAVTVSVGFTEFPIAPDDSVRQAVRRAAEALRWAKSHQRNTVVGCDPRWSSNSQLG